MGKKKTVLDQRKKKRPPATDGKTTVSGTFHERKKVVFHEVSERGEEENQTDQEERGKSDPAKIKGENPEGQVPMPPGKKRGGGTWFAAEKKGGRSLRQGRGEEKKSHRRDPSIKRRKGG